MAYGNKFGTEVDRIGKDGLLYCFLDRDDWPYVSWIQCEYRYFPASFHGEKSMRCQC